MHPDTTETMDPDVIPDDEVDFGAFFERLAPRCRGLVARRYRHAKARSRPTICGRWYCGSPTIFM